MSPLVSPPGAILMVALLALAAAQPAAAQVTSPGDAYPDKYPRPLAGREGPAPPKLAWHKVGDIPLPGPVSRTALTVDDGRIQVRLEGGTASVAADPSATPEIRSDLPSGPGGSVAEWVVSPDALFRFRAEPAGRIVAEKRRSASSRWRRAWRLRVAGGTPSPPLLIGAKLVFASVDNQVYCVRASNGHRVWAVDLGQRLSRAPVVWRGPIPSGESTEDDRRADVDLLLVVPDAGNTLIALDAYNGRAVASLSLPIADGWFVSSPLVLDDRSVAIARQGYEPSDAGLAFYRLRPAEGLDSGAENPGRYNGRSSGSDPPSGG